MADEGIVDCFKSYQTKEYLVCFTWALKYTCRSIELWKIMIEIDQGQWSGVIFKLIRFNDQAKTPVDKKCISNNVVANSCCSFCFRTSIAFGFVGWMAYITTIVLRHHTPLFRPTLRIDEIHTPFWQSEKGVRIIFTSLGTVIVFLLYGK